MMKTTQKKFWETLAKTTRSWHVTRQGNIRRRNGGHPICPVCEVARILMPGTKFVEDANPASWAIGLPQAFTNRVVAASDDMWVLSSNTKVRSIRRKLLKVLGLKEKK